MLPFSALIINKVDIWHGQGYYAQLAVLLIYSYHLFKKNKPLSILFGYVGLTTLIQFVSIHIATKQYPVLLFLPFYNFLCIVILFDIITTYCNKDFFYRFIKYFSISFMLVLLYCLVQKLGLDQFYRSIDGAVIGNNKEVVGIMGNPMHNSHFIAIGLPVLFILKGWWRKLAIYFALLIIVFAGSTSGLVVSLAVLIFGQIFLRIFNKWEIGIAILLAILFSIFNIHHFNHIFNPSGRIGIWQGYFPIFNEKPIMGWGLGIINELAKQPKFFQWRHLHFEYYHFAVECGLIAVGLAFWAIIDYFRRFKSAAKDQTTVIMASIFLAFLLTALFGFPMHLWVLSVLGIVSYSYFYRGVQL